jgi:membrane associated rhomboid family serine protease
MTSVVGQVVGLAVVVVVLVSLFVIARVDRPEGEWGRTLRTRFVLGVPWGTLVTATGVLWWYLIVQGGLANWGGPVTIPFRSWSWFYPTGVLTASFSHAGPNHLIGNLIGTLLLGSLAEYAYGHFPTERGTQSFTSLRTHPYVRAFAIFPAVAIVAGIAISVFSLGPVIGFSGVVFAFAGFALVRYPMTTIVLVLGGQGVTSLVYRAIQNPFVTRTVSPSGPSAPWWAGIAIQGHALGMLLGIVLAAAVFARRERGPSAFRLYAGLVFFGVAENLWAIYLIEGSDRFVLLRAPGVIVVFALAAIVAVAVANRGDGTGNPLRVLEGAGSSWRTASLLVVVLVFAVVAGISLPTKLNAAQSDGVPGENPVEVRDYTVTYAEDTAYRLVSSVDVPFVELPTSNATASGVIVISDRRHVWYPAISKAALAYDGSRSVTVGGVGWRESVTAIRRGWRAAGGERTYKIWLQRPNASAHRSFSSTRATASPILDGKNVSVAPAESGFEIVVHANNSTIDRARMPAAGENVTVAGITFERDGRVVTAVVNDTRVRVFTREDYRNVRGFSDRNRRGLNDRNVRGIDWLASASNSVHHSMRYASASTTAVSASWKSNWLSTSSSTA